MYFFKSRYTDNRYDNRSFSTLFEAMVAFDKLPLAARKVYSVDYNGPAHIKRMIFEGFNKNDLESLLLPVVSLDEYVAKNDDNIVLAFYITNEPLAVEPLKIFCDQTHGVIDTDMSDSDTFENTSVVYVELLRNVDSKQIIHQLICDVAKLANLKPSELSVRLPNIDKEYEYSTTLLDIYFRRAIESKDHGDTISSGDDGSEELPIE